MRKIDYLYLAKKEIGNYKLKSSLIVLSIAIGILASTLNLYHTSIRVDKLISSFQDMGSSLISVNIEEEDITPDSLSFLSTYFPIISYKACWHTKIRYLKREKDVVIIGTDPLYRLVHAVKIEKGRFLFTEDVEKGRKVCLIGKSLADELKIKVGDKVKIENNAFRVIGIWTEDVLSAEGAQPLRIIIPFSILREIAKDSRRFEVVISSHIEPKIAQKQIREMLKIRFPAQSKKKRIFDEGYFIGRAEGLEDIIKKHKFIGKMTILSIGLVTLLLAGFGIGNLIMLSVRQRYKEIGIMRAVGAKRDDIFYLFFVEGVLLSLYGLFLGGGMALFFVVLTSECKLSLFFYALGWVSLICLPISLCSYYPASLASKISPCEAIRTS